MAKSGASNGMSLVRVVCRRAMAKSLAGFISLTLIATVANGQTARDVRGVSPYEDGLKDQPAPKLIVDPPLEAD